MKQNERKQKKENIVNEDLDLGRFFESESSDQVHVNRLNPHKIKNEFSLDYKGDFELSGSIIIGRNKHKTNIRFKSMDDFESYINAIEVDDASGDVIFTGYV